MTSAWQRRRRDAAPEPTRAELPKCDPIQPSAEDIHNGHTAETLAAERETSSAEVAALIAGQFERFRRAPRPKMANSRYSPLRAFAHSTSPLSRRRGR
jgi:hypothetical protein